MGHLLEAIKKLEQKRAAVRPEPVRAIPASAPSTMIWRIDAPHRAGSADRMFAPHFTGPPNPAATARSADEVPWAEAIDSLPEVTPATAIADEPKAEVVADDSGVSVANEGWRFAAPDVTRDYHNLAARLIGQLDRSREPQTLLLTAVSHAALDALSPAALAAVLSSKGNVLWIDTQRPQPTPDAIGPAEATRSGWHDLRAGKVTWEEIIAPTSLPDVSFVGCGNRLPMAEGQEIGRHLFDPLRSRFSVVLIAGGLVDEAATIARYCGAIGLAVAVGKVTRGEVDRALQTLAAAGCDRPLIIAIEPRDD
ncbi:MAG TPA: hypothetical protein VHY91_27590 [Pirellulales bacterium]|jgi:hypothetical protein|nr:hypothetical protein [Pirellulales bacterium]